MLIGRAPIESVLKKAGRNLAVLASGAMPPHPCGSMISENARRVITEVADTVDDMVIENAPVLLVSDGVEIAAITEATLTLTHAGKTTRE